MVAGEPYPSTEYVRGDFSSVKAIYFDLDDTLCGYWDASKKGLKSAFQLHGPDPHTADEWVRHWAEVFREFAPTLKKTGWYQGYLKSAEPTRTEQMRLTLARAGIDDPEQAAVLSQAYMVARDRELTLFPDAVDVIASLMGHYPLGLITNGPADLQRQEIATLQIEPYFENILIEGELGLGKPAKHVFQQASDAVRCKPHQMLMVGNSYGHDVRGALESGWHAIWIRRPSDVPPQRRRRLSQTGTNARRRPKARRHHRIPLRTPPAPPNPITINPHPQCSRGMARTRERPHDGTNPPSPI